MSVASAPDLDLRDSENIDEQDSVSIAARTTFDVQGTVSRRRKFLTDKGKSFLRDLKSRKREKALIALRKEIHLAKTMFDQPEIEMNELEFVRDRLDVLKDGFNEAQQEYDNILETQSEKDASYQWYDMREREFVDFRMRLCERIQSLDRMSQRSSRSSVTSRSRRSHVARSDRSHVSSRLSVSQARAEAAAKAAAFEVELQFLERENESKRLQIEKQYALEKAKEKAFKQILEEETQIDSKSEKKELDQKLNQSVPPFSPMTSPNAKPPESDDGFPQTNIKPEVENDPKDINSTLNQLVNLQAMQAELSSMLIDEPSTKQGSTVLSKI